ncbi:MAG TPA: hypothetical protein VGG25_05030 [Streptosporangiaceae bacterium]|jgi:hypothetical protein
MQDREDEAAAGTERGADGRDRAVEVVDVGQAEVAGHQVEPAVPEDSGRGHVGVNVADA